MRSLRPFTKNIQDALRHLAQLLGAHLLLGRLLVAGLLLAVVVRLQRCMLQFQSWETKQLRTVVLKPTPCGRASNNDFARESTNSTLQVLTC